MTNTRRTENTQQILDMMSLVRAMTVGNQDRIHISPGDE